MRMLEAERFQGADKYLSYLKTLPGRLRADLAWENLRGFLPANAPQRRVLDLGGGTGSMSVRLAKRDFSVTLLDGSAEMLGVARQEAEASQIAARISFCHADAHLLPELFEPESFDVVLCHNLLEYVADAATIVAHIACLLREDAVVSFLVRNRRGEVLKAAIQSQDPALAKATLSADTVVDSLFGKPVGVFDAQQMLDMLAQAGLHVAAQYGVRVFSDYRDGEDPTAEASYQQLLDIERILGAQPEFAAIARYSQWMARRSAGFRRNGIAR